MKRLLMTKMTLLMTVLTACVSSASNALSTNERAQIGSGNIKAEIWADNWFSMYVDGKLVKEDSVPITTERSFNQETFSFQTDKSVQMAFVLKDFKENDTGLEYIGTNRQQMGDGGFIAQFTNTSNNQVVAYSDARWKCLVIHQAPLDKRCENEANPTAGSGTCQFTANDEPEGWKDADFDDSAWPNATVYSPGEVGPKEGYDEIIWNAQAKLIWGSDLETDNTILCRAKLNP